MGFFWYIFAPDDKTSTDKPCCILYFYNNLAKCRSNMIIFGRNAECWLNNLWQSREGSSPHLFNVITPDSSFLDRIRQAIPISSWAQHFFKHFRCRSLWIIQRTKSWCRPLYWFGKKCCVFAVLLLDWTPTRQQCRYCSTCEHCLVGRCLLAS